MANTKDEEKIEDNKTDNVTRQSSITTSSLTKNGLDRTAGFATVQGFNLKIKLT